MRATALVTGATSGIGAEFAQQLAAQGYALILVARNEDRLDAGVARLGSEYGVPARAVRADLSVRADVDRVSALLAEERVEFLVNSAGFGLRQRFLTGAVADEQAMIDVLVSATMRLCHGALPGMVARGRGYVVNVSSVAALLAAGTYSAAKAWVTVFSESLARELAGSGVHVTALAPGYTRTEFHQRAGFDVADRSGPLWLDPSTVVAAALRDVRRGRALSVPGSTYKAIAALARYGPRPLVRRATGHPPRGGYPHRAGGAG